MLSSTLDRITRIRARHRHLRPLRLPAPSAGRRRGEGRPRARQGPARVPARPRVGPVSQTDGDQLPDVSPRALRGNAPEGLWDAIAAQIADAGYTVERGDCGEASGRTHFASRRVAVRDDVDEAEATCTLTHELAHVLLHDPADPASSTHHRGTAEIEAESVAYIVCTAAGMVAEDTSLPYVAGWPTATRSLYASPPSAS